MPGALRFGFGNNWSSFAQSVDDARVAAAERSLSDKIDPKGKRFLDAGCGSGLSSLAALNLGAASVTAFDYDPQSVAASTELRTRFRPADDSWQIMEGDVLDEGFLASLGTFDVVYSWGVLHHTGAMALGIDNVCRRVAPGGELFIALYNDQGPRSRFWTWEKRVYNRLPRPLRTLAGVAGTGLFWGRRLLRDSLRGHPTVSWRAYASERGMSPWHDVLDWIGGYPFEVATPQWVIEKIEPHGFALVEKFTTTSMGNNEFIFKRIRDEPVA